MTLQAYETVCPYVSGNFLKVCSLRLQLGPVKLSLRYLCENCGLRVPSCLTTLRIQHCHCCDLGQCCGLASIPGPGTPTCHRQAKKKKKKLGLKSLSPYNSSILDSRIRSRFCGARGIYIWGDLFRNNTKKKNKKQKTKLSMKVSIYLVWENKPQHITAISQMATWLCFSRTTANSTLSSAH